MLVHSLSEDQPQTEYLASSQYVAEWNIFCFLLALEEGSELKNNFVGFELERKKEMKRILRKKRFPIKFNFVHFKREFLFIMLRH